MLSRLYTLLRISLKCRREDEEGSEKMSDRVRAVSDQEEDRSAFDYSINHSLDKKLTTLSLVVPLCK